MKVYCRGSRSQVISFRESVGGREGDRGCGCENGRDGRERHHVLEAIGLEVVCQRAPGPGHWRRIAGQRDEDEAKRDERKAKRHGVDQVIDGTEVPDAEDFDEFTAAALEEAVEDEDAVEEDEPDLMLREAAQIVGDLVELTADNELLNRQFSQLLDKEVLKPQVN